jgi:hypothetical protein
MSEAVGIAIEEIPLYAFYGLCWIEAILILAWIYITIHFKWIQPMIWRWEDRRFDKLYSQEWRNYCKHSEG